MVAIRMHVPKKNGFQAITKIGHCLGRKRIILVRNAFKTEASCFNFNLIKIN